MNNKLKDIFSLLWKVNRTTIFCIIAIICFGLSFIQQQTQTGNIKREKRSIERKYLAREKILDSYILECLNTPVDQRLKFESFPDDMVIYRYHEDTLQSWINLFPVSNDEVDLPPFWYRIHNMESRNLFNTPLAYLNKSEQYVNLGASWYVVKTVVKDRTKLLAGLLIKTEYISDNLARLNNVNPNFNLNKQFTIVPINEDDSNIIYSKAKDPLFSLVKKNPLEYTHTGKNLRWLALLFLILSVFSYHERTRNYISLLLCLLSITAVKIGSEAITSASSDLELFSPNLYADSEYVDSLGTLLINHVFIFLIAISLFMVRKSIIKSVITTEARWKRWGKIFLLSLLPISIVIYIHTSLRSLILNSTINLEAYKIAEINIYTILVYLTYALLFIALLFSIHIALFTIRKSRQLLSKPIYSIIYLFITSLYLVTIVSYFGFKKEYETNIVWTNNLAIERDISLELQLRSVERSIINDPLIPFLIKAPHGSELILRRITELYFWNAMDKYDLRLTICGSNDKLSTEEYSYPVDCYNFFNDEIIGKYGKPLANRSAFYYLNYFKNQINYLGRFSIISSGRLYHIYLEIDSKTKGKTIGYPTILLNQADNRTIDLPAHYSFAKYYEGKLSSMEGDYNYPSDFETNSSKNFYSLRKNGHIHFVNNITDGNFIITSRPIRSFFAYIIFFSYIMLLYSLVIFGAIRLMNNNRDKSIAPSNSLRKRITYLITLSLIIALISMSIGSIYLIINIIEENQNKQMTEKLVSVQNAISRIVKYSRHYNEINTREMYEAMDRVAANTGVDINLFDPLGRLIRSTKPDVFDSYVFSSRIDPVAYNKVIYENNRSVISPEAIADIKYHSLYAPIYNNNGTLLTIVNIPYFPNDIRIEDYASSIIAAVINLYIIFLIITIFGGISVANSLTKPLEQIGKKMEEIDFSEKAEYIEYHGKDEVGKLVAAYNNMIDALDESTHKLAQAEREHAWREMARQIAHEIKNPLTPMRLSIQHLMRMKQQNYPNWQDKFDALSASLLEQIDILTETANEFSSFARFYNEQSMQVNLISLLQEQKIFFDNRDNLKIYFIENVQEAMVYLKKNQIARALINLISNAVQAIENQDEGIIRITVSEKEENYCIEIEDNGPGVSYANQDKLFKPNFTTKSGGTGLGLAITKNIIYQSQGSITYSKSEALGGANFTIILPKIIS